jgi:hypothetical protein
MDGLDLLQGLRVLGSSGVSNVKREYLPRKITEVTFFFHMSPLMYGPDSLQDFGSLALREFRMFVLGKLPK